MVLVCGLLSKVVAAGNEDMRWPLEGASSKGGKKLQDSKLLQEVPPFCYLVSSQTARLAKRNESAKDCKLFVSGTA
jgi:hypothetical protein